MEERAAFVVGFLVVLCLGGDYRVWQCQASNVTLAPDDTNQKENQFTDDNSTDLFPGSNSSDLSAGDNITERVTGINTSPPSPKQLTLDDFILLTYDELARLRMKTRLAIGGRFQNRYLIFKDDNGTQYAVSLVRQTGVEEEIRDKLKNSSGDELICIDRQCLTRDQAKETLANYEALRLGTVQPSQIPSFAIMTTVVLVVGLSGITGNLLIIIGVFKSKKLRNSTTVLLSCMAVSDILVLALCLPFQVTSKFVPTGYVSLPLCRVWFYVRHFAIVSSTLTMSVMAVDRYIAVCHPLKARTYSTVKNARVWVAATWIAAMIITAPVIWMTNMIPFYGGYNCYLSYGTYSVRVAYHTVVLVLVLVIPLGVMLPTYARMFCVLYRSTAVTRELQNANSHENAEKLPSKPDSESIKSRIQVIRMLVAIVIVFSLCWGPPTLISIFDAVRVHLFDIRTSTVSEDVMFSLETVAICNSFFNPLIYFAMSRQFRQFVFSMCRAVRERQVTSSSGQATTTSVPVSQISAVSNGDNKAI